MCNNNCQQGRDCTCEEEFSIQYEPNSLKELESELLEQTRIIGMSGEREADLLGKIDRLEREVERLKSKEPVAYMIVARGTPRELFWHEKDALSEAEDYEIPPSEVKVVSLYAKI